MKNATSYTHRENEIHVAKEETICISRDCINIFHAFLFFFFFPLPSFLFYFFARDHSISTFSSSCIFYEREIIIDKNERTRG